MKLFYFFQRVFSFTLVHRDYIVFLFLLKAKGSLNQSKRSTDQRLLTTSEPRMKSEAKAYKVEGCFVKENSKEKNDSNVWKWFIEQAWYVD